MLHGILYLFIWKCHENSNVHLHTWYNILVVYLYNISKWRSINSMNLCILQSTLLCDVMSLYLFFFFFIIYKIYEDFFWKNFSEEKKLFLYYLSFEHLMILFFFFHSSEIIYSYEYFFQFLIQIWNGLWIIL
jgi:hypothetical protein